MEEDIKKLVEKYYKPTDYGDTVPVSGKVFGKEELENLIQASLEGWWTEGKWCEIFEKKLSEFLGLKYVHSCNSGSSANLLAIATLCSPSLGERQLVAGDEVITLACGFPTTVNPIIQNGLVPVFIDVELPTYDVKISDLEEALSKKTKAVILPHTLGNPFNLDEVVKFCREHKLWLIEDNCDALGSTYKGKMTGTFGDMATLSFYPAHHITTAEGGAVVTNNPQLSKIIRSIRDWGRHCWCPTGKDNTCNNRYSWKLGNLPEGFDHKYIYGELGYNLKLSDLHAAIGVAQIDRLEEFIKKRKENFKLLHQELSTLSKYLTLPEATADSDPSWFGFLITVSDEVNREKLLKYLAQQKIGTRLLFGGNLVKQPYLVNNPSIKFRIIGDLTNSDLVMNKTFWVGLYPALNSKMLAKTVAEIKKYFNLET